MSKNFYIHFLLHMKGKIQMKRFLSLVFVLMLIVSLAACNKSPSPTVPEEPTTSPSLVQNNSPIPPTDNSISPTQQVIPPPEVSVGVNFDLVWGDPTLEKCVRAALNIPNEQEVSEEITSSIKKLSIMPKDDKVEVKIDDKAPVVFDAGKPIGTLKDILRYSRLTDLEIGYAEG